jgi:hypothetical protein
MKLIMIKVEQYNNQEGCEAFFLLIANDTAEALEFLNRDKKFLEIKKYGGNITVDQCNESEILKHFSERCYELNYDSYN